MIERDHLVDEDIGVFDDRPLVAVLEVMAVFVGGGEGLAAGGVGAVDQGEGRFPVLEVDEGAGELGAGGDGKAQDAAAVELGEGEDVADGLIAETEATAFLDGQALGEDGGVGVEGGEREAGESGGGGRGEGAGGAGGAGGAEGAERPETRRSSLR
jgi:hypothetical protein